MTGLTSFNDSTLPLVKPTSAPEAHQNCICYYHQNLNLTSCIETPVNLLQPLYTQACPCRPGLEKEGEKLPLGWHQIRQPKLESCLTADLLSLLWWLWALSPLCCPSWGVTWGERITCTSKHSLAVTASRRVAVL